MKEDSPPITLHPLPQAVPPTPSYVPGTGLKYLGGMSGAGEIILEDYILVGHRQCATKYITQNVRDFRVGQRQDREEAKGRTAGVCSSVEGLQDKSGVAQALAFLWLRGNAGAEVGILGKR